jgi:hypothetical protein
VHRLLEVPDVRAHRVSRALGVAGSDRLEEGAMLLDGFPEIVRTIERHRPDPQREHVILLEGRLEEVVVRSSIYGTVDPLVEGHELAPGRFLL